jgi:DNA-binding LytR/AlgR family response regulator
VSGAGGGGGGAGADAGSGLRALVVDDEVPARTDLAWLLEQEPGVATVGVAGDANEALRILQDTDVDVVFLDVRMPGLHGLDLARVLGRFARPPQVVFVTAYEEHAVDAFELQACDYLLKPVRAERLRTALDRVRPLGPGAQPVDAAGPPAGGPSAGSSAGPSSGPSSGGRPDERPDGRAGSPEPLATLAVESAGRTRFVARADVRVAEASGDYTRLHTADGRRHLVRIPLSRLEASWRAAGFFRIHRSYLVALPSVNELRTSATGATVVVDGRELPVSRRQAHGLKEALIRARLGEDGTP